MLVSITVPLILVAVVLLLNAGQAAVVCSRRNRLESDIGRGVFGARGALRLHERQDDVAIGTRTASAVATVAAILYVGLADASGVSTLFESGRVQAALLFALIVGIWSLLLVLVGDVLPSRFSARYPEEVARVLSPLLTLVLTVLSPWIALVNRCTGNILGPTTAEHVSDEDVEEDIKDLVDEGQRAGVIEPEEKAIIDRVFKLDDKPVASLMTQRSDVIFLEWGQDLDSIIQKAASGKHTWYPVRGVGEDDILGLVSLHSLISVKGASGSRADVSSIFVEPLEVPESMSALKLLELFRSSGASFAVVRDEHGAIAGIATVYDVLQVIVGDIGESAPDTRAIVQREDGSFLVDASSDVRDLFDILGISQELPFDRSEFHSLGGFIMMTLGYVPKEGERFNASGYTFEVVDMDNKRIDKVLVSAMVQREAVGT